MYVMYQKKAVIIYIEFFLNQLFPWSLKHFLETMLP